MSEHRETAPSLQLESLLGVLDRHAVDFIVIGGIAGVIYGSAYPTYDFDVLYARDEKNLERMASALEEMKVTLRNAPAELPFHTDARALAAGNNFTFDSEYGPFDILGEAAGMRDYDTMRAAARQEKIFGVEVRVASLDDLIRMKRAAGRPKDRLMAEEYVAIAEDQRRSATGEK